MYFINDIATPILNTPYFSEVFGRQLPFDDQKLVRVVEMIALPRTVFKVIEKKKDHILEVSTEAYPSSTPLYIDERCGSLGSDGKARKKSLPPPEEILKRMKNQQGLPYVWGGNYGEGISEWKSLYPPQKELSSFEETHWTFHGVDCSGLLYQATDGYTPRNTSGLMTFGKEVPLEDIKPLDLILFPGHVIIALGDGKVIESSHLHGGVVINLFDKRLSEIEVPITLRRFHPAFFERPYEGDQS
ncbi:MAG: C40 family peptidase [Simkaniaceae bacterium]|nr:MAG: C40 family peptidase [Simkaniaceae bacterium]